MGLEKKIFFGDPDEDNDSNEDWNPEKYALIDGYDGDASKSEEGSDGENEGKSLRGNLDWGTLFKQTTIAKLMMKMMLPQL